MGTFKSYHGQQILSALVVLVALSLAGCDGGSSGSQTSTSSGGSSASPTPTPTSSSTSLEQRLAELEAQGKLPVLDRSNNLTGPDTNGDGIRDDIEAYINSRPITDVQKRAERQFAKALQAKLTVDLRDATALTVTSDASTRAINCLYDSFKLDNPTPPGEAFYDILKFTYNTKSRMTAYLRYNDTQNGSTSTIPEGNTCE